MIKLGKSKVSKWGSSLVVLLPEFVVKGQEIKADQEVEFYTDRNQNFTIKVLKETDDNKTREEK